MEFNDNYPNYETMAIHSEEEGVKVRKKLWRVFWIMLVITLVELGIGINQDSWGLTGTLLLKFTYIIFTIVKAGYIVYAFMHLGDENHLMRKVILWPYISFALYLVYMATITEGTYTRDHKYLLDTQLVQQKQKIREDALKGKHGGEEHGGDEHKESGH